MWLLCSYCSASCTVLPCAGQSLQHTHTMFSDWVCVWVCGVTECLNYGLIVSLAGFCCCHHIGPVKVNYWNMFICCQPPPQAVTCMETQTNTHRRCSLKQFTGHLVSLKPSAFSSALLFLLQHTLYSSQSATWKTNTPWSSIQKKLTSPVAEIQVMQLP